MNYNFFNPRLMFAVSMRNYGHYLTVDKIVDLILKVKDTEFTEWGQASVYVIKWLRSLNCLNKRGFRTVHVNNLLSLSPD